MKNDHCAGYGGGGAQFKSHHLGGRGRWISELEASMVYRVRNPIFSHHIPQKKDHCTLTYGQVCRLTSTPNRTFFLKQSPLLPKYYTEHPVMDHIYNIHFLKFCGPNAFGSAFLFLTVKQLLPRALQ